MMRPASLVVLLACCSALPAMAQPVRQPLPPLSTQGLGSGSFDVRAFDPMGMRAPRQAEARSTAPVPPPQPGAATPGPSAAIVAPVVAPIVAPVQEARADTDNLRRPGVGRDLLSDWWTRQQFGGLR